MQRKSSKNSRLLWKWVVGPGLTRIFFVFGKSSQNSSKPVLIFWSSIPCVLCLYIQCTLLKVVSYYDLSVLSMSVIGFQKKKFGWGWVDGVSSIQVYFGFLEFFNFAKPLKVAKIFFYFSMAHGISSHVNIIKCHFVLVNPTVDNLNAFNKYFLSSNSLMKFSEASVLWLWAQSPDFEPILFSWHGSLALHPTTSYCVDIWRVSLHTSCLHHCTSIDISAFSWGTTLKDAQPHW